MIEYTEKNIWEQFLKGITEFGMINRGDKIAVGISGGKDSLLLVTLLKRLKEEKKYEFDFYCITLDQGYEKEELDKMMNYLESKGIKNNIVDSNIWKVVFEDRNEKNPCSLCSKMRRGIIYREAEKLGCNKIALGHHMDDIAETVLINMLYAGTVKTMLPLVKSETGKFTVIRPLCFVREDDIIKVTKERKTPAMKCGCKMYELKYDSKRLEMKVLIKKMERKIENIRENIFSALKNVYISE